MRSSPTRAARIRPTLIDFVQNRHGKVVWPENWRPCDRCNAPDWNGKPMPRPQIRGKQVVDAMSAYQMVHIAEGVIQRGTATVLRDLDRPMFGKTGTTFGPDRCLVHRRHAANDRRRLYRL